TLLWRRLRQQIGRTDVVSDEHPRPEAIDELPHSPDFVLSEPGSGFTPTLDGTDSVQAQRFKTALADWETLAAATVAVADRPPLRRLELAPLARTVVAAVDPDVTVRWRTLSSIDIPPRILGQLAEDFGEVMAYPVFDLPMYEPLTDISSELFLPNLNLIEQNSITLLETNRRFIEAYLIGLNHEFARELLWRAYPTDQAGSYFRQFWDPRGFLDDQTVDPEQLKERLRDIPEVHRWSRASDLGE